MEIGEIIIATLCGTLLTLLLLAILFTVLRLCGFRILFAAKRRPKSRTRSGDTQDAESTSAEGEIPEDELLVILTAAAMEALDGGDTKRFRVVAFRRI